MRKLYFFILYLSLILLHFLPHQYLTIVHLHMFPLHQSVMIRPVVSMYQVLHFFEKKIFCDMHD